MNTLKLFLYIICLGYTSAKSQPYMEGGNTRHRFAQLNLGIDQRFFSNSQTRTAILNGAGQFEYSKLNNQHETRLIIGGTHFWGHADFFIAIPVLAFGKSGIRTGVETGAKIFPYQIKNNKIRPYIGFSWMPTSYKQENGTDLLRSKYPITAGLVFNKKNNLFELGFGYFLNNSYNYYISKSQKSQVKIHPFWFSVSYKFMLETTLSAEKDWQSGRTKRLTDTLAVLKRLNGFTLAIGPSSSFFLKSSSHNSIVAPYADNHKTASIFPEFGLGYYIHKPDLQFNLAYRTIKSKISAYDFSQNLTRKSLTIETYKFLFDYHGFVPFAGVSASYEWLTVFEQQQQYSVSKSKNGLFAGLTFGWDIRPNRIQSWYLRTNLRYFPGLNVKMQSGNNLTFDQLEFNFIQLVVYPNRLF